MIGARARTAGAAAARGSGGHKRLGRLHRSGEWVAAGAPVVALLPPAAAMAAFLAIVGGIAMLRYRQTIE